MSEPYLGEIRIFAGNYAPQGWNFCDGTLLDIASNDALYALIGTTYGGNGQTNFALPDLRGRVPIHRQIAGQQFPLGGTGGVESVTLTVNQTPAHTHVFAANAFDGTTSAPSGQYLAGSGSLALFAKSPPPSGAMDPASIGVSAGGAQPHDNMQPYQCINYIIALAGIYPTQS